MNTVYVCEGCGKKLIERTNNGIWVFKFGRFRDENGNFSADAPIEMRVYGSIRMRCFRRKCRHENILNFFPDSFTVEQKSETNQSTESPVGTKVL